MSLPASKPNLSGSPQFWLRTFGRIDGTVLAMSASIAVLHLVGWFILIAIIVPQQLSVGSKAFGIGLGLTAYTLGMRHAFDADHIAAIDNTTRKLIGEGKRPLSVGFWFSLGHASIVFGLTLVLTAGIRAITGPVSDSGSELHNVTGLVGTLASSSFLYLIAALNILALARIWKAVRRRHAGGGYDELALERVLQERGLISRLLGQTMSFVSRPWQMYLVGLLFGLGFDTATEIALLVLTGSGVASGLPWYALLCLPVLFAAGMSLLDTLDGALMCHVYGWAYSDPTRKLYYNLIVTGLSSVVALVIGTVEMLSLFGARLHRGGAFWSWVSNIDLNAIGFGIVGLFIATCLVALVVRRYGRIEERGGRAGGQQMSSP